MAKKRKKKAKVVKMQPRMSLSKYVKLKGRTLPIHSIHMSSSIMEAGKGHVIITRTKKSGAKILGFYMIDMWCLGVKDTFLKEYDKYDYEDFIIEYTQYSGQTFEIIEPNYAYNLIYGAVEYAEDLGLSPHKDFSITEFLLAPVDEVEYEEIEFGKDGRPCYIHYDGDRKGDILKALTNAVGKDGFDFIDGQPFLNDLEEEFSYDFSEVPFDLESDRDAYLSYCGLLILIEEIFAHSEIDIAELFETDQEKILEILFNRIKGDRKKDSEDEDLVEELRGQKTLILGAVEKYLIYFDIEFMLQDHNINVFDSTSSSKIMKVLGEINLFTFGQKKIDELCNCYLNYLLENENLKVENKIEYFEQLVEVELSPFLDEINNPKDLLLDIFEWHADEFGNIDFNLVKWEK